MYVEVYDVLQSTYVPSFRFFVDFVHPFFSAATCPQVRPGIFGREGPGVASVPGEGSGEDSGHQQPIYAQLSGGACLAVPFQCVARVHSTVESVSVATRV